MCRIVEEYSDKKYSKGKNEGRIEGMIEGKIEGRIEGRIETVNEMLKDNVPLEIALRYGKIDLETYKKYNKTPLQ